jgi:PAS domain S-box-containing protein
MVPDDTLWQTIANAAPVMIWMADVQGELYYFNSTWQKFTGRFTSSELSNEWFNILHPDDKERYQHIFKNAFKNHNIFQEKYRLQNSDGEYRWILENSAPRYAENGNFIGFIGYGVDITNIFSPSESFATSNINQSKLAEVELSKSQAKNNAIFHAIPDLIFSLNQDGIILDFKSAKEDEQVLPSCLFIGKSIYEVLTPDLAQQTMHHASQALSNNIVEIYEYQMFIKDEWRSYESRLVKSGEDELLAIVRDITERKTADTALRESEKKYRELASKEALLNRLSRQIRASLEVNNILKTAVTEVQHLLNIDRCDFMCYRPSLSGQENDIWEILQESKYSEFPDLIGLKLSNSTLGYLAEKTFNREIIQINDVTGMSDQKVREFLETFALTSLLSLPIHTQSGVIGSINCAHYTGIRPWQSSEINLLLAVADQIAIAIDQAELYKQTIIAAQTAEDKALQLENTLRELASTQAQLIQTEKMSSLGQLVAGVAHEINNPVNFIFGNLVHATQYIEDLLRIVELYQKYYPEPIEPILEEIEAIDLDFLSQDLPKLLSSMKIGANRIRQIVLSLRNFSRLDEAEMKLANIHEGIDNTLLLLQNRLKGKIGYPEIQVIKEYGEIPQVECFPGQLNQVFMNLLVNAIDVLEESLVTNPQISIRTFQEGNNININIADNGSGITEEIRQKLFDPFFTTKPIGKGTGMGLSISYQIIVEKHRGQLLCFSTPGKGAEFAIVIPSLQ